MKAQEVRQYDMLRRVRQYLNDFSATLAIVNATAARKELDELVKQMGINEALQATSTLSARSQTATQAALRRDLWIHHMRPVATIAAAHLRDVPGFAALRMPRFNAKLAVVVQQAIAMAEAAQAHRQVFVENGRSENFADELVAAASVIRGATDARSGSIAARAGARDGIKATASRAHVILTLLDAQVRSVLIDDPKTLAGWNSAKRVGRGPRATGGTMTGDQPGAADRSKVPGAPEDTETRSHQRASFSDPLPGGDPTAPGSPEEPGGETYTQAPNPNTSKALKIDDSQKGIPGVRESAP
jgi:hypothetical protein